MMTMMTLTDLLERLWVTILVTNTRGCISVRVLARDWLLEAAMLDAMMGGSDMCVRCADGSVWTRIRD